MTNFGYILYVSRIGSESTVVRQWTRNQQHRSRWQWQQYKRQRHQPETWFILVVRSERGQKQLEPSERITVHRLPLAEARELVVGQEIGDGQSMAGLLLLDRWLAAGGRP